MTTHKSVISSRIENIYSLTPMQEGMLFHNINDSERTDYVIQNVFAISGTLTEKAIKKALDYVMIKHSVLRTAIVYENIALPRQIVLRNREIEYGVVDYSILNEKQTHSKFELLKEKDIERGFDLQNDTLLRVKLVRLSVNKYKMIWSYHHIILDGWSLSMLFRDFISYYEHMLDGKLEDDMLRLICDEKAFIPEYGEYVRLLESKDKNIELEYWNRLLLGYDNNASIEPVSIPKPSKLQMQKTSIYLSQELSEKLKGVAATKHLTMSNLVESAWGIILSKYNNTKDVVFGKVVSGRDAELSGIEKVLGLFINTIPIRVRYDADTTIAQLLENIKTQDLESANYSHCPLSEIQKNTKCKGGLLQTILAYENYYIDDTFIGESTLGLKIDFESGREQTNYDLTLASYIDESCGKLKIAMIYDPNKFCEKEITRIIKRLIKVLEYFAEHINNRIDDIELVLDDERVLIESINSTASNYPRDKAVIDLFEEQVHKFPSNIAIECGDEKYTYSELNVKINQLAWKLINEGVERGDFIAIFAKRSVEAIVGICGILKAGGAYVPIDLKAPNDRIKYIIDDCKPKLIVTYGIENELIDGFELPIIRLEDYDAWSERKDNPKVINEADDLAYLIYTSGTTGYPKGTLIKNYSISRLVINTNYMAYDQDTKILQTGALAFDASTFEIWGAFLNGGTLIIAHDETLLSCESLKSEIVVHSISHIFLTTTLFNYFVQEDVTIFDNIKYLLTGGEKISEKHVRIFKSNNTKTRLSNVYGPTETCSLTSYYHIPDDFSILPIGKPISNTQMYVLDGEKLCGIGVQGELCITGDGVSPGYFNRPELTEQKFVNNPFGEGKMYRSGDKAVFLDDGNVEFVGRIDNQVKIRGFRIETAGIEAALRNMGRIKNAAVVAREGNNSEKSLYAYIVADDRVDIPSLKDKMRDKFPEYMIPSFMMQIDRIPVTLNGKADVNALPDITVNNGNEFTAPRDRKEQLVCSTISKILDIENIGIENNFLELGGDSIKSIRVVSKLREAGYAIYVRDILGSTDIKQIAKKLKKDFNKPVYSQNKVTGRIKNTPILDKFAKWDLAKPNHFNQDMLIKVSCRDYKVVEKAIEEVVLHHDILRAVYRNNGLEIIEDTSAKSFDFVWFDFSSKKDTKSTILAECDYLQASIDIEKGPLAKSAFFITDDGDYMFICIHHLVVDAVSWGIIIEDIHCALNQIQNGEKVRLQNKTASYIQWADAIDKYKKSNRLEKELDYWEEVASNSRHARLVLDNQNLSPWKGVIEISLTAEQSELLMKSLKAFNTKVNELLISAIGMSVNKLTGSKQVSLLLEGHGRQELDTQIDVYRTVGWFTSMYPIVIDCYQSFRDSIVGVKETMRMIPNAGIGYALLENRLETCQTDITFNYLGKVDGKSSNESSFCSTGKNSADENIIDDNIVINSLEREGKIFITIGYSGDKYSKTAVSQFAETYKSQIIQIAEYCNNLEHSEKTPSDYSANGLSIEDLNYINNLFSGNFNDIYALTPLQEGMLYYNIENESNTDYVVQQIHTVGEKHDEHIIEKALDLLAIRYDALRTSIVYEGVQKPFQIALEDRKIEFETIDLSSLEENMKNTKFDIIKKRDVKRGFKLQQDSLLRVKLVLLGEGNAKMIWTYHHIIIDGWCMSLILGNFANYYNRIDKGFSYNAIKKMIHENKKDSVEYGDYLKWIENKEKEESLEYWNDLLADYDETVSIKPMKRVEQNESDVKRSTKTAPVELTNKLQKLAIENHITMNAVLEAAWGITLMSYNNTNDVVFGKVVSGRNHEELSQAEQIVGLLINTVPVRMTAGKDVSIKEFLSDVYAQNILSNDYSYCSLADIQGKTKQKRDLIKTLYVYENYYVDKNVAQASGNGFSFKIEESREQTNYDITFAAYLDDKLDSLKLIIMYNPNLYAEAEIKLLENRVIKILESTVKNCNGCLNDIDQVTDEEKELILGEFNNTVTDYPKDKSVVELLDEVTDKFADKEAVVYRDSAVTYKELKNYSNCIAQLLYNIGIVSGDTVVVLAKRSIELIAGIYGILRAGAIYVPIDLNYPEERIQHIVKDCQPKAIVTFKIEYKTDIPTIKLEKALSDIRVIEEFQPICTAKSIAYIMYTSGTIGKPKGSLIGHKSIIRLVKDTNYIDLDQNIVILQTGSMAFDASTFEVWGALLNGGKLVIGDDELITSYEEIKREINKQSVNTMWITSSLFNQLIQTQVNLFDSLDTILVGGEKLSEKHIRMLRNHNADITIINGYGPTENTTFTTTYNIPKVFDLIPIGRPIANTHVYIMQGDKLCGIGMQGELCISGDGLALGYLNCPELTEEKFVDNMFGEGKLYRSGDLACWRLDGTIDYLGRIDEQVKIRGFRIELEEVENITKHQEYILDAKAIVRTDGVSKSICLYFVAEKEIDIQELRSGIQKLLPDYMIPSYMIQLDELPLNRNGKVDKKSLPEIEHKSIREYIEPRNQAEKTVSCVFSEVLGAENVGMYDNFFELGGDSIKAIRIVSKMRLYGYKISVKHILSECIVKDIASAAKKILANEFEYEQNEVTGTVMSTPIIKEFESWNLKNPNHFNQAMMINVETDDENIIQNVLAKICIHHDILRALYKNGQLEILNSKDNKGFVLYSYDLHICDSEKEAIEQKCQVLHEQIDIENGPLFTSALFKLRERNLLFLCIHHLLVDGVSWRIIIEDINTALKQAMSSKAIQLPQKTASFIQWSQLLNKYTLSQMHKQERQYWVKACKELEEGRLVKLDSGNLHQAGYNSVNFVMPEDVTNKLLHKATKAYHLRINDVLISGIGRAVGRLTDQEKVAVMVEGHGRESLYKEFEIDRTVGWFTCLYPIIVPCCDSIEESIVLTKEKIRAVPNNGIDYGLLINTLKAAVIDISFNYLGKIDEGNNLQSEFATGKSSSDKNQFNDISINGIMRNDELEFTISYKRDMYSDNSINLFADYYRDALVEIITYCADADQFIKTPSDFTASDIQWSDLMEIYETIHAEQIKDIYSLTSMQEGMLYHKLVDAESTSYVIQQIQDISGNVNENAFNNALKLLVKRYDVFRTAILYKLIKEPRQVVLNKRDIEFEVINLYDQKDVNGKIENIRINDLNRGFDLENDSLIRVKLIKTAHNRAKIIWCFHHIIIDGWSTSFVFGDFMDYYAQLIKDVSYAELTDIVNVQRRENLEYGEYLRWLNDKRQIKDEAVSYWSNLLADYSQVSEIKPNISAGKFKEQMHRIVNTLEEETTNQLLKLAKSNDTTINNVLEAALGIILQEYNYVDDVVFGKIVSGRNVELDGAESIVGLFINTVPVRVKRNNDTTISQILKQLKQQAINSEKNAQCTLTEIQNQTALGNNLFKVLFAFENYYIDEQKLDSSDCGFDLKTEMSREETNYAITIVSYMDTETSRLKLIVMYNPNDYHSYDMQMLVDRMEKVLCVFADNIDMRASDISLVLQGEKHKISDEFNDTSVEYNKDKTIVDLFEDQVDVYPDKIALTFHDKHMTYAQLNKKANQVAHRLRAMGVGSDDRVVILAERSFEMIIGIIGVLKAGGAYVPVDAMYPEDRIHYILDDCKPIAVVKYCICSNLPVPCIDLENSDLWSEDSTNPIKINKPSDLAYVIYTSGTTGNPKGVMIEHKGVVCMQNYLERLYEVDENDCVLQFANCVFDASVWEITISLFTGAELVLIDIDTIRDIAAFKDYMLDKHISITLLPPHYYLQLDIEGIKVLTTGGAAANADVVRKALNNKRYINAYGPTENTVLATHWENTNGEQLPEYIPIGKPIDNTKIYVLRGNKLCGIGIPGELCIEGDGVARGYLNREALTKEKFCKNPFGKGTIYRSGDLVSWLPDGNIAYIGRIDNQVKVRGFRIELGEVESAFRSLEEINDVAVTADKNKAGDMYLSAYLVASEMLDIAKVRENIHKKLPSNIIPSNIVQIKEIPLTRSGKLDKVKIKDEIYIVNDYKRECVSARNEYERKISEIWADVLGRDDISVYDNFSMIGGDSLKISRVFARISQIYPGLISIGDIFANPTIDQLAKKIEANSNLIMTINQMRFPQSFTESISYLAINSRIVTTERGDFFSKLNELTDGDIDNVHKWLLFAYIYLLFRLTENEQIGIWGANKDDFFYLQIESSLMDNLNRAKDSIVKKYAKANKYKNINIKIKSKEDGCVPAFSFNSIDKNQLIKNNADFSINVYFDSSGIKFTIQSFNKRLSEQWLRTTLNFYVAICKTIVADNNK